MRGTTLSRRRFLAASAASVLLSQSHSSLSAADCEPKDDFKRPKYRLALIIANGSYPKDDALPPAQKNASDLAKLLREGFGFDVAVGQDMSLGEMRQALAAFAAKARAISESTTTAEGDLATIVYFCGHGLARNGINYLVPANVDQNQDKVEKQCLSLQADILSQLPVKSANYPGLNVVLIDACRTGENQAQTFFTFPTVQGCTVTIASSEGGYAFFPNDRKENSIFTQALLEVLDDERNNPTRSTPVEALLTLIEKQTEALSDIKIFSKINKQRNAAGQTSFPLQKPTSSKQLRGEFVLQSVNAQCIALQRQRTAEQLALVARETVRFDQITAEVYPSRIRPLCTSFLKDFPDSDFRSRVLASLYGAEKTAQAIKLVRIATDTLVTPAPTADKLYKEDLVKASTKGDKDASQRVAWMYRDGTNGLLKNPLRYQDFLRLSAELGNGIASFELYEVLRRLGSPDARYFLQRAKQLGFPVPKDLPDER